MDYFFHTKRPLLFEKQNEQCVYHFQRNVESIIAWRDKHLSSCSISVDMFAWRFRQVYSVKASSIMSRARDHLVKGPYMIPVFCAVLCVSKSKNLWKEYMCCKRGSDFWGSLKFLKLTQCIADAQKLQPCESETWNYLLAVAPVQNRTDAFSCYEKTLRLWCSMRSWSLCWWWHRTHSKPEMLNVQSWQCIDLWLYLTQHWIVHGKKKGTERGSLTEIRSA